ncbi:MAG: hypothetical protein INQ03_09105 [Candidatus Heimdallarchaeota archaeon]|nr:hypothetical protein [Candidatus Heimdallarchaeota archaeon]
MKIERKYLNFKFYLSLFFFINFIIIHITLRLLFKIQIEKFFSSDFIFELIFTNTSIFTFGVIFLVWFLHDLEKEIKIELEENNTILEKSFLDSLVNILVAISLLNVMIMNILGGYSYNILKALFILVYLIIGYNYISKQINHMKGNENSKTDLDK